MNKPIHLTTPLSTESVRKLKVQDIVILTGTIFTARDMAHLKLKDFEGMGKPLPEVFAGSVIFHAGPVVKRTESGFSLLTIGPTTSIRMEPHSDFLGHLGVKAIIGKGGWGRVAFRLLQGMAWYTSWQPRGAGSFMLRRWKRLNGLTGLKN